VCVCQVIQYEEEDTCMCVCVSGDSGVCVCVSGDSV
jgi:hypothetical protein